MFFMLLRVSQILPGVATSPAFGGVGTQLAHENPLSGDVPRAASRWYLDRDGTGQMTSQPRRTISTKAPSSRLTKVRLKALVAEATVDAYGESEQAVGFLTMMDDHLATPFSTTILGVEVTVEKVDVKESDELVAVCRRARTRQRIPILDLPLPAPPPAGAEWIEAYRYWRRGYR